MRKIINKIISYIKGEEFILDRNIPLSYIFNFLIYKFFSLICGIIKMRKFKRIFIAPSSVIICASKITTGKNLNIACNCHINALSSDGIQFGNNVSIGKNTTIECSGSLKYLGKGIIVGNNVGLGSHGFFGCAGGIKIGDDTILGNYVSMHSENHSYVNRSLPIRLQCVTHKGIVIGKDCWIGAKATILDGARIGDGCVIAAGAVVRGIIPPYSVIGGVPAKIIKQR